MWWRLKKLTDNENEIVYAYSRESDLLDGQIRYHKKTEKIECLKLASNDTQRSVERFFAHVYGIIVDENAPDERMVATG